MVILNKMSRHYRKVDRTPACLCFMVVIVLMLSYNCLTGIEVPLDFHGRGLIGRYLNSDTIRYYLDTSVDIYCTMLRHNQFSMYLNYRDDLEVSGGYGGVLFDPRYVHYYIVTGFDWELPLVFTRLSYVHDCIHDIDFAASDKPIFNRFRIQAASRDFHFSRNTGITKKILWSLCFTYFAHWQYHGWDINAGADYQYEIAADFRFGVFRTKFFGCDISPEFLITKGERTMYHQGIINTTGYFINGKNHRFCLGLDYNIFNNDVLKQPDKLWLLSLSAEF